MSYVKNNNYRDFPFCAQTPYGDFYTYSDISDIPGRCYFNKDEMYKCRTIGILQSLNGRFYLTDIRAGQQSEPLVQLSVVYLKSPLHSTVIPYPVQVFGMLHWKNRPVIFANIIQVMNVKTAIRVKNALSGIASIHLARNIPEQGCDKDEDST